MTISPSELAFYAFGIFLLFITPGPVWVALIARALSGGFAAAWPLALGVTLGDLVWPFLAILGVTWILSVYGDFLELMRWVATATFLVMGYLVIRSAGKPIDRNSHLTRPGKWAGFLAGLAVIVGNPKAILFYMGVLPGFFDLSRVTAPDIAAIQRRRERIGEVWQAATEYMRTEMPWTDPIIKPLRIGPGRDGKIEARFHGPDPEVLRGLAEQARAVMRQDPEAKEIRDDWREPVKVVQPVFNEQVGRQLGITREDLAAALQFAFEGTPTGLYRDGIRLLPILTRAPADERGDISNIQDLQVWSPVIGQSVPVSQVVSSFETVWENAVVRSRNRQPTIIAMCNPTGELATPLFERLRPQIEAIDLPPGYSLSWGGEYEDSQKAQQGLGKSLPVGFLLMILTSILLFGKLRQPLIIWLTVPLAIIGITAGLLGAGGAFDFMSILGALSLVGLLIKNAIVLIEEIDQQIRDGKERYAAILDAAVSRMRPVVLAAATTILGLIPLLPDVFFENMAITIMAGLGFATVLTLVVIPVVYSLLDRKRYEEATGGGEPEQCQRPEDDAAPPEAVGQRSVPQSHYREGEQVGR